MHSVLVLLAWIATADQDLALLVAQVPFEEYNELLDHANPDPSILQANMRLVMEANSAELQRMGSENRVDQVCQRIEEGCPVGWKQESGVCFPSMEYSGPCQSMPIQESAVMSKQCNAPLPCKSSLYCEGTAVPRYDLICPVDFIAILRGREVLCQSAASSKSRCLGTYNFGAMTILQRETFSVLCKARYPCEASQCPQDFRSACPEGWIQKDQTCLAPSINETIPSYCQQVPSDFVDSSPEVKAAFVKRCPNARFPCLQFTSDECIKDFHSCPLGFDQVHDHGCKPRVLQKTNCPNEINLMVMDSNQLEMLSKECGWKFSCKDRTVSSQGPNHLFNVTNSIRRARKKPRISGNTLAPNWSMVFE